MELAEIVQPLLNWYHAGHRDLPWRREVTPYRVWVSEIMLQQTRVEAVKDYFTRFMLALPTVADLAACPEEKLLKLWEGLGYYNRVRNLQKAAQQILQQHGGELPADYDALLALPGIGSYTAGAVASIAFGLPHPAVDGNVLRVISRITASRADVADPKTKTAVEQALRGILPVASGDFNQALMELGATVCAPNAPPDCPHCPVNRLCEGRRLGIAAELPVKTAKKPRRIEQRTILLMLHDGCVAIRRRPAKGLLAGLWELPSLEGTPADREVIAAVRGMGLEPLRLQPLGEATHIFTHVEWRMQGVRVTVADPLPGEGLLWAHPEELREVYPLPSAFRAYLDPVRTPGLHTSSPEKERSL